MELSSWGKSMGKIHGENPWWIFQPSKDYHGITRGCPENFPWHIMASIRMRRWPGNAESRCHWSIRIEVKIVHPLFND